MAFVLTISCINIIDSQNNEMTTAKINNAFPNKMAVPKYTPLKTETPVAPKAKIAPIHDKEDGQVKRVDNTKPSKIGDARKQYEAIDPYFASNIKGALNNGIHVGVYFYSVAKNEMEALEEAQVVVDQIKPYRINYPVAFDLEDFNRYRLSGVSNAQLNKNAVAFLNYIKGKGYTPMHYGSKSRFGSVWDMGILNNYKIWLAHYTDKTNYAGKYNMWQYTSKGIVPGINGNVDMNIAYFKLSPNVADQAKSENDLSTNPNEEVIKNTHFTSVNEEVVTTANVNFRKSPTTDLDNKIYDYAIAAGTKMLRIGISDNGWAKVIYNNITGYISNEYLTLVPAETDKIEES